MKLRKRDRNTFNSNLSSSSVNSSSSSSALGPSSSSTSSTPSTSTVGNQSSKRAGKRQTAIRGRSRTVKKVLKEKNAPTEVVKEEDKSLDLDCMADVFQKCQHLQYHDECIKKLREYYHSTDHLDFCVKFSHFLRIILRSDIKSPFTKNCLTFIPKLINTLDNEKRGIELKEDETMDELAESIFGEEIFTEVHNSKACVLDYIMSEVLLKELNSSNTTVRQNVCLLISRLLRSTKDIDDKIYKELQDKLLQVAGDRNYLVRALAAFTLILFQDPNKQNCPVSLSLRFHVSKDPAYQVRIAALKSILVTPGTLHFIIKKIRDVKAVVRKLAYIKIADNVPLPMLSNEQRLHILKEGLNDRHPNVRKVVEDNLLSSWLKQCDGDLVKLMVELNVKTDPKIAKKVLFIFSDQFIEMGDEQFGTKFHALASNFRESYLDDKKLLKEEHQIPEKVFVWLCLNTFIKNNEDKFIKRADKSFASKETDQQNKDKLNESETGVEDWADRTLNEDSNQGKDDSHIADYLFPELPHICQYLQKFVDSIDSLDESSAEELIDKEFVYNQLVSILLLYDVCDEAQQNYILEMIRTIIFSPNLHIDFRDSISPIMKFIARRIFKDPNHLIEFTAECTSKVYNIAAEISAEETVVKSKTPEPNGSVEPSGSVEPTFDADYARLTMEIEEYRDQLDKAIAEQDFMTAQSMKNKLDELATERERLQNIRLQQKSTQSQSQIPPSQVPPTQPFDLNDHPDTLLKCLQIFVGALEHGKFETANTLIFSHIDQIVLPSVLNTDVRTRSIAVKALGLSCLLSDSLFRQHCNLILQVSKYDGDTNIRVIALHSIFDGICKHGIEPLLKKIKTTPEERRTSRRRIEEDIANLSLRGGDLDLLELSHMGSIGDAETQADIHHSMMEAVDEEENDEEDEGTDAETTIVDRERSRHFETLNSNSEQDMINSLVTLFTEKLFNNGIDEIEETAVEGFAKLMILGVIYSPSLLSRLIIIWYLPETRTRVLQFLGVFLPIYVGSESKYVREDDHITVTGQTCLVDCFIDTLEVLFEAKHCLDKDPEDLRLFKYLPTLDENSQYRQIDLKNVTSFMLNLLKPSHHKHLLSNLIHKMYSIVTSNDQEFKFYEDFLVEYLLKACLRLSLDDIDDIVFNELRPVMIKLIVKVKSRMDNMRALSRKKAEKFIRSFLVFYKSLGRGELNASLSHGSGEGGDDIEGTGELDELEQMEEDLNLDPLGSMPELSDDESKGKTNDDDAESDDGKDAKGDDEDEEEGAKNVGDDDEIDSLSDVSETLRWSDIDENET